MSLHHIIPPLPPDTLPPSLHSVAAQVEDLLTKLTLNVNEAQDNLLTTKVSQAQYVNTYCAPEIIYNVGSHVMLSTLHRYQEY